MNRKENGNYSWRLELLMVIHKYAQAEEAGVLASDTKRQGIGGARREQAYEVQL